LVDIPCEDIDYGRLNLASDKDIGIQKIVGWVLEEDTPASFSIKP